MRHRKRREAQKKALAEARVIIGNNQLKQADPPPDTPSADPPHDTPSTKNVLTTTQWLSVFSIFVSLAGVYYKREEIKSVFTKKTPVETPPSPVDATPKRKVGITKMD